ncbi:MAG: ABC transporter permease subunit [Spirochaetia bacterium]
MRSLPKIVGASLLFITVFLLIISGPVLIGEEDGRIALHPKAVAVEVRVFVQGVLQGDTFKYIAGKTPYDMRDTLPKFFFTSLKFILGAAFISLTLGIGMGILFSFRTGRLLKWVLDFLHVTPDFILALFLQILSITIYQIFQLRIARLTYTGSDFQSIVLPLLTMVVTGTVFIIRCVEDYACKTKGEEYILYALSRGMGYFSLITTHLLVPVLHFLRSDFHRLLALIVGNLFIVERIFKIPGITTFLFEYSFLRRYDQLAEEIVREIQFNVVFWGFLSLIVLYWIVYFLTDLLTRQLIRWRQG